MELDIKNIVGEIFKDYHPHTELGIDLKLITRLVGRLKVGQSLWGFITFDSELHFTFVEDALVKKKHTKRNECVLPGKYVNLHRTDDGLYYFAFKRPILGDAIAFVDFCVGAAHELLSVADCIKKNSKLFN